MHVTWYEGIKRVEDVSPVSHDDVSILVTRTDGSYTVLKCSDPEFINAIDEVLIPLLLRTDVSIERM